MQNQTNTNFQIKHFKINSACVLGKGATGLVYQGLNLQNNQPIAVKAIQMSKVNNEVTKYLLEGEKKALMTIKNQYIVKTYDIVQEKDYCYIMMEECCGGTLKDYIEKKGKLDQTETIQIFKKIVNAYISIVQGLFIHRDLKTANIMIRSNGDPVIIDFGYCEMIMGKRPMIQYNVGSPSYMSPESYTKSRYSEKSDIWALGVILYECLTGKTLDSGWNIKDYFKNLENKSMPDLNSQQFSPVCKELLELALKVNPEERATIHKLKYIIDKSFIPKMQMQLKKVHSEVGKVQLKVRDERSSNNKFIKKIEEPKQEILSATKLKEKPLQMNKSLNHNHFVPMISAPTKDLSKIRNPSSFSFSKMITQKQLYFKPPLVPEIQTNMTVQNVELVGLKENKHMHQIPTVRKRGSLQLSKDLHESLRIL